MGGSSNTMNTSISNPAYGDGGGRRGRSDTARNSLQNFMGNGSKLQDGGIPSRQKPDMSTQLLVMMKRSFIQQSHAKMCTSCIKLHLKRISNMSITTISCDAIQRAKKRVHSSLNVLPLAIVLLLQ